MNLKKTKIAVLYIFIFLSVSAIADENDSVMVNCNDLNRLLLRIEKLEKTLNGSNGNTTNVDAVTSATPKATTEISCDIDKTKKPLKGRFGIGGYGEATMTRAFYSDNYLRYYNPEKYKDDSYGQFDLPHVCINMGYDFGKGWSLGTEIEFEHGGTESAVEMEEEEGGEYESEIERGGEVALEQLWLQKSFMPYATIRVGMMIIPVGGTNAHHEPNQFFGVFRPEGDNTILPCTWHEVGVSFFGQYKFWHYEIQFLPGLDSDRFGRKNWIHYGAGSPYEFKMASCYAAATRHDFYPCNGLRLSLSGYIGTSFANTLSNTTSSKYDDIHGLVGLGSLDFKYEGHNVIFRGGATYGHLEDAATITKYNMAMRNDSPSKKQVVASDAYTAGAEIGYNFFGLNRHLTDKNQKFYVFARYDIYDSQFLVDGKRDYTYSWCGRQRFAAGFNYFPIPQIVIKGEFSYGLLNKAQNAEGEMYKKYNDEPAISLGIAYCGIFTLWDNLNNK